PALVDTVQTVGGPDTGPDAILIARDDLAYYMRIRDVGACHTHHIKLSFSDGVTRRRHVGDPGSVENRELGDFTNLAGKIEMRRRRHALDWDDFVQRSIRIDMATNDIEEIELVRFGNEPCDLNPFLLGKALLPRFICDHADADEKIRANRFAHGIDHGPG